jgi:hypothetical protein
MRLFSIALSLGAIGAMVLVAAGFAAGPELGHSLKIIVFYPADALKHVIWRLGILNPLKYLITALSIVLVFWSIILTTGVFVFLKMRDHGRSTPVS